MSNLTTETTTTIVTEIWDNGKGEWQNRSRTTTTVKSVEEHPPVANWGNQE